MITHLLDTTTLEQYLQTQTLQPVTIQQAVPLAGGASRDSWHITALVGDSVAQWVIRRDLPTQMLDDALTREQEFRLMAIAHQHGVQVALVRYLCADESVLGKPFFIMDYMAGVSVGPKVLQAPELAAARTRLPQQMAEQLARIHTLPTHELAFLHGPQAGQTPAQAVIAQAYGILDSLGVKNPVWEWGLRWAMRHAPTPERVTFIHGDFRIGNLLVTPNGLNAVIDWEFGHLGDPDEELGYVCMRDWRFGHGTLRFAGLSDRETFLQAYEAHSGRTVNRASVDWWEIMGNIRWGIICLAQANRHLSGVEHSVELASLGRRSAEMQLEALRLIQAIT